MSWSFDKEYIMENKIQIKKFAWKLEIYGSYKPHFKRSNSISVHFHTGNINNLASCANDSYEETIQVFLFLALRFDQVALVFDAFLCVFSS